MMKIKLIIAALVMLFVVSLTFWAARPVRQKRPYADLFCHCDTCGNVKDIDTIEISSGHIGRFVFQDSTLLYANTKSRLTTFLGRDSTRYYRLDGEILLSIPSGGRRTVIEGFSVGRITVEPGSYVDILGYKADHFLRLSVYSGKAHVSGALGKSTVGPEEQIDYDELKGFDGGLASDRVYFPCTDWLFKESSLIGVPSRVVFNSLERTYCVKIRSDYDSLNSVSYTAGWHWNEAPDSALTRMSWYHFKLLQKSADDFVISAL